MLIHHEGVVTCTARTVTICERARTAQVVTSPRGLSLPGYGTIGREGALGEEEEVYPAGTYIHTANKELGFALGVGELEQEGQEIQDREGRVGFHPPEVTTGKQCQKLYQLLVEPVR